MTSRVRRKPIQFFTNQNSITATEAENKYGLTRAEIATAANSGELCFCQRSYFGKAYTKLLESEVRQLMQKLRPGKLKEIDGELSLKSKKSQLWRLRRDIPKKEKEIIQHQKQLKQMIETKEKLEKELGAQSKTKDKPKTKAKSKSKTKTKTKAKTTATKSKSKTKSKAKATPKKGSKKSSQKQTDTQKKSQESEAPPKKRRRLSNNKK